MRGYLLDLNIIRCWFDKSRPEHPAVASHIDSLPAGSPLRVSAITLGEIAYGHRLVAAQDPPEHVLFNQFVQERLPNPLPVKASTGTHYGEIRARLFQKFAPREKRRGLRPEQLVYPATAVELGIEENDLWLAAQAIEYKLALVTQDKMTRIRGVVADLLQIEDWTTSPAATTN